MRSPTFAAALSLSVLCAACAPSRPAATQGRMPAADIQRVVRSHFDLVRACYGAGLRENPKLQGRVAIYFVIDTDGTVSRSEDHGSDLPDRAVIACVAEQIGGLRFPKPEGGVVRIVYPIIFKPGDGAPRER